MARSNAPGLTIPQVAQRDIKVLLEKIDVVRRALELAKDVGFSVSAYALLHPISEKLDVPYSQLRQALRAIESLLALGVEYGSIDEALDRILASAPTDLIAPLEGAKSELSALLNEFGSENPISTTFKAERLSYLHEHILRDAEVISDARPVFDAAGTKILEFVISHSLVVSSTSSGNVAQTHFAMDAADVVKLRDACERAIVKAKTLKSLLGGPGKTWKVHLLRDDDAT